jgi:hypothetical protein
MLRPYVEDIISFYGYNRQQDYNVELSLNY